MGLLDHLWDDTVAGPRPDNGLGKLRKHQTFSFRPSSGNDQSEGGSVESTDEAVKVTRSIMIVKPPGYQGGSAPVSAPVSPAGSTPPVSPFSENAGGGKESFRFRRRSSTVEAFDKASEAGPRSSPPPYGL
ncbi:PREDICTED: dormancy-associated protein homolog 3 isoform X2 [Tarenaya hassleriana]|uniref:dormancy-associated protein homolog 3 isoform X2 n=1 Tax=Tarenaya hassleriana TaxID=28532 RepID=UPI00053C9527|nr:PREDICTED: dormancy-associated protein homolog 3 isoform X2 [Tarenaya hassleriana]